MKNVEGLETYKDSVDRLQKAAANEVREKLL